MTDQNQLSAEAVTAVLKTNWLGQTCTYFPEIGSTNQWLREQGERIPHGTVVLSDFQSAGKGRHGRGWVTPHHTAVALSIRLVPDWPAPQANWLTMIAGLAAVEAIQATTDLQPLIKWPNDIIFAKATGVQKVGGILLEGNLVEERLHSAIIGIGLNVNLTNAELAELPQDMPTPATSLLIENKQLVPRLPLIAALLERLENWYDTAVAGISPQTAWQAYLHTLGREVVVTPLAGTKAAKVSGTAVGVDNLGQLLVTDETGHTHTISAGDVTLRA